MKRVTGLVAALLFAGAGAQAQSARPPRCGIGLVQSAIAAQNPDAMQRYKAARMAMLAETSNPTATAAKTAANGPIPVVFHVVLTTAQLNQIGGTAGVAERVDSSIAVLNRDYNRKNGDSTRIPTVFKPLYANVDIQFGLARRDPHGQATPGYEIYTTSSSSFPVVGGTGGSGFACSGAKYSPALGGNGLNAWDPSKYLNVWVCEISPSGILGIALSPGFVNSASLPIEEKGVVLNYRAFGKKRLASQNFISGIDSSRTLTHETGHFFELNHIWGDDEGACPGDPGYSDDGIGDTPIQDEENYFCPSGVLPNCNNSTGGEMYMNYMDYCDDRCLVMFTTQQAAVMRSQVQGNGPSVSLTQNPSLVVPLAVNDLDAARFGLTLSPNPVRGAATLTFNAAQKLQSVIVMDATGRTVRTFAPRAAATGTLPLDVTGLAAGLYTLRAQFADGAATRKLVIE